MSMVIRKRLKMTDDESVKGGADDGYGGRDRMEPCVPEQGAS